MNGKTKALLKEYAARYETTAFLKEDPARFMHLVQGTNNQAGKVARRTLQLGEKRTV